MPRLVRSWHEIRVQINDMLVKAGMGSIIDIAQTGALGWVCSSRYGLTADGTPAKSLTDSATGNDRST
jgi:hypothetical protein